MPLPKKLLAQGVRDMVRICDGRMSGTAYGTVVLHVAPEAAAGGPLALVRTGDEITLDVPGRQLTLEVSEAELAARQPNAATLAGPRSASRPARGAAPRLLSTPSRAAAGSGSTSTTSGRPTQGPTWTSWSARPGTR